MKIFYYILLLLLLSAKTILAQWYVQESGTTADLRGVWFVDSLNGWACGDSTIILHTTNGGQEWERQNSTVNLNLEDVFFWDLQTGWVVGDSGKVIHTTDGGITWSEQQTTVTSLLHHVQFVTLQQGFASGERGTMISTYDGGTTWQASPGSDSGSAYISFFWIDESRGTIIFSNTSGGFQFHTVDGGMIWFQTLLLTFDVYDVWGYRAFYPTHIRNFYWDVGYKGKVLWIYVIEEAPVAYGLMGQTGDTLDLHAVTLERGEEPLKLWSVGKQGWIISSVDTGQTWQTIQSGILVDLNEVSFPQKNRGWAVGDSGVILRYDHPTWINNSSPDVYPVNIQILDPYPNPFNSYVTIRYSVPQLENISLVIYNSLGQSVKHLFNGYQQRGNYELRWDGRNEQGQVCSSGLYLAVLRSQHSLLSKKLILLK